MQLPDIKKLDVFATDAILGAFPDQINADFFVSIIAEFIKTQGPGKYLVAVDMRDSSAEILNAVVNYATVNQIELVYAPLATFDFFRFSVVARVLQGGFWIGAASGAAYMNGLRLVNKLGHVVDHNEYRNVALITAPKNPQASKKLEQDPSLLKDYFFAALKEVDPLTWRNFKIVIDGGNGLGGHLLKKCFNKLPQIEAILLNCEAEAAFPHHYPNPLIANNNLQVIAKILETKADFGISLDQDGDSFVLINSNGEIVPPAVTAALFAEIVCKRTIGAKIGHDYNQIYAVEMAINANGGNNVPMKNDYATMSKLSQELAIDLTTTSTGIYMYKDMNFAPSPLHSILTLCEYLNKSQTDLVSATQKYFEKFDFSTELTFIIDSNSNWDFLKQLLCNTFSEAVPNEICGLILEDETYRISINLERAVFIKIYIETISDLLLQELQLKLFDKLKDLALFTAGVCEEIDLESQSLNDRAKFEALLDNLWFTWNPHYILPIIDMYGDGWRKNMPPEALIANYGKERLQEILSAKHWELCQNLRLYTQYLKAPKLFSKTYALDPKYAKLKEHPIAYFCMEFGLVDWMQIYSGGLGILAGDYLKGASDMGVPVVGVGIFYHQGYLHQDFSPDGGQIENYIHQEPMDFNMEPVKDKNGNTIIIDVILDTRNVKVRAWRQKVGVVDLLLLDTNFEANEEWEDRLITGYLYGGDIENRIRQEIVLGIAGARLLKELNIEPAIFHMNEGHSGFLVIERTRAIMASLKCDFATALKKASEQLVFTNHTLKQAGNDIFDFMLFEKYLTPYLKEIDTDIDTLFNLGGDHTYSQGGFSMTVFGLRHAKVSNAVSKIHATAAKNIWPNYSLIPVTNGVHMPTWVSTEMHRLLDQYLGESWHLGTKAVTYQNIQKIPAKALWDAHIQRKNKLIQSLNSELGLNLNPDYLTIAWSRRLAAYKRPDLLLSDIERLEKIINNANRPVQFLIAGKSHPKDTLGKQILQKMNNVFKESRFANKIEIIPGYNWQLARRMVSGADMWLNTPYRYEEACGTSGMKAAANGVIQFTTMDGWTDEVDWFKVGWVISETNSAESLYDTLENQIVPLFYDKNSLGYNEDWVAMMRNSMQLSLENFSAERMLHDYLRLVYQQIL